MPTGEDETGVVIDALFASSGIETEVVAAGFHSGKDLPAELDSFPTTKG